MSHHNFRTRPDDIYEYNMDETGVKTSDSKPPRVISVKGKKQVGVVATAEKGQLTTVICACSATDRFIPPCFIFGQRKRMNERLLDGAPNGSQAWVSDSGWINNSTFNNWLQIFIDKTRPTSFINFRQSHYSSKLGSFEFSSTKACNYGQYSPYTSHKQQLLDVSVYRSFKVAFEQALDTFQKNHPGRRVNHFDIARLVCTAYEKSAIVQNATSGFRKAGIFPFNRHLFTDLDFAPDTVYKEQSNTTVTDGADKNKDPVVTENSALNNDNALIENPCDVINDPVENNNTDEPPVVNDSEDKQKEEDKVNFDHKQNEMTEDSMLETRSSVIDKSWYQPSTSYYIPPIEILPPPKVTLTIKKRKVRYQKSEILTSSPFKNAIEMKNENKAKPKLLFNRTIKGKQDNSKEIGT
ncbi:unnamed protein product [Acanthoscelides obtectus]|uniref:DDE-1 domain-containing protein n=1 Tax=Acanthoscelides obtectus TaxID=200917 RepID=A0A9P0LC12_ACAOB|nr:unnamed protein product [Acanthoscelides obtectus]CAK1639278.1 hypothetical protein AOBTE_LOCUS11092 [Acanthoscelides obtectus]